MKVFTLHTVISGPQGSGCGFRHAIKQFDSEETARVAQTEHGATIKDIVEGGKIVMQTDQGPRVIMPLSQFLGQLGIGNIGHALTGGEVHGGVVLAPTPRIVLPGN